MSLVKRYLPITLERDEQVVLALDGRILPSITDFLFILHFALMSVFTPILVLRRVFRPVSYIITTQRVIVVEPEGLRDSINIGEITKIRGSKTALMISSGKKHVWLSRLPDAWFFEVVIENVIKKRRALGREE